MKKLTTINLFLLGLTLSSQHVFAESKPKEQRNTWRVEKVIHDKAPVNTTTHVDFNTFPNQDLRINKVIFVKSDSKRKIAITIPKELNISRIEDGSVDSLKTHPDFPLLFFQGQTRGGIKSTYTEYFMGRPSGTGVSYKWPSITFVIDTKKGCVISYYDSSTSEDTYKKAARANAIQRFYQDSSEQFFMKMNIDSVYESGTKKTPDGERLVRSVLPAQKGEHREILIRSSKDLENPAVYYFYNQLQSSRLVVPGVFYGFGPNPNEILTREGKQIMLVDALTGKIKSQMTFDSDNFDNPETEYVIKGSWGHVGLANPPKGQFRGNLSELFYYDVSDYKSYPPSELPSTFFYSFEADKIEKKLITSDSPHFYPDRQFNLLRATGTLKLRDVSRPNLHADIENVTALYDERGEPYQDNRNHLLYSCEGMFGSGNKHCDQFLMIPKTDGLLIFSMKDFKTVRFLPNVVNAMRIVGTRGDDSNTIRYGLTFNTMSSFRAADAANETDLLLSLDGTSRLVGDEGH